MWGFNNCIPLPYLGELPRCLIYHDMSDTEKLFRLLSKQNKLNLQKINSGARHETQEKSRRALV